MTAPTVSQPAAMPARTAPPAVYGDEVKKPWYKAEFYIGRAVKSEEVMNFSRQASAFLRAGVPILDSLAVVPVLPSGSLLDAGTGAGFPGIPAAIARPDLEVVLVDSVQKKVAFLKSVLAELRLPKVKAVAVRLEGNPSREELPRVHAAVARAFASPEDWLRLAQEYVLPAGVAICMLGPSDKVPAQAGALALKQELAYTLPTSKAQRRLAIYKHI